jgi:hypothetical protein
VLHRDDRHHFLRGLALLAAWSLTDRTPEVPWWKTDPENRFLGSLCEVQPPNDAAASHSVLG